MAHVGECTEHKYFLDVLNLFFETQWLYNTPVTDLLTKGLLDLFPKEWLNVLQTLENQELNDFVVTKKTNSQWPKSLKAFLEKCRHTDRLPNLNTILLTKLPKKFQIGLNDKKQHEISQLANLVHMQCAPRNIKIIVDFGAGLGYVCQLLYHLYGYRVLGLEKNHANVNNARTRQSKLYPDSLTHVKYNCCDLTYNSVETIETILRDEFQENSDVCLIGLHACGDLSIHASKIFRDMQAARIFVMISCCYHKLSISKSIKINASTEKQYFNNFPLSNCFNSVIVHNNFDVGSFLRQPFLRLACQEPAERWNNMSIESHNKHSFYVLARALLQLYATQNGFSLTKRTQKGTRKSQCLNFETYIKDSLNRYILQPQEEKNIKEQGIQVNVDEHEKNIIKLWKIYCDKLKVVELYTALQLILQASAESLVLQDRLCWMHEEGFEATIIPVTNKQLSPRSHAIVCCKR
ncbi:PREDICTED: methyltransferase-like protein 25 [Dufourea novaeangliae]|uniref:Protein RRNAD1 n=1 Tax=Dufourea novaeangliae TaxID=178035 RepID=A0A154PI90_DUFNO|nr:PREDICTED: methyltransferase-like protein 25 [Dufourea novaeangliae]KZC11559.1 Protein RRNAD1 [Dufourea novaeangliae]